MPDGVTSFRPHRGPITCPGPKLLPHLARTPLLASPPLLGVRSMSVGVSYHNDARLRRGTESWSASTLIVLSLLATQAGLAIAMHQWPIVATADAWIVGLIGLSAALVARPAKVAMIGAYVVGSDVLWRMNGALVPWEFAKYLVVAM